MKTYHFDYNGRSFTVEARMPILAWSKAKEEVGFFAYDKKPVGLVLIKIE